MTNIVQMFSLCPAQMFFLHLKQIWNSTFHKSKQGVHNDSKPNVSTNQPLEVEN